MKINKRMINETALKREMLNEYGQIPAWLATYGPPAIAAFNRYGRAALNWFKKPANVGKVGTGYSSADYFSRDTQADKYIPNAPWITPFVTPADNDGGSAPYNYTTEPPDATRVDTRDYDYVKDSIANLAKKYGKQLNVKTDTRDYDYVKDSILNLAKSKKNTSEGRINEGPAYEYKKHTNKITKSMKQHQVAVLDLYELLRKKGLNKEASMLLDAYKKNLVTFKKTYDKIMRKLV